MIYTPVIPPFSKDLVDMSKPELRQYREWFLSMIPERIGVLANAVRETPGFGSWDPDLTPDSLNQLGEWFAIQVEMRPRTALELKRLQEGTPFHFEVSKQELSDRTFSLAMDIGMYLSQVFLNRYSCLKWNQPLGSKRNMDYGHVVLAGFGSIALNAVSIIVVLAYGLADNTRTGRGLRNIYDIWEKKI